MADALQVKGLKKSYGNIPVLKGIDFSVQHGEIFALLGVNGAGKTTALECIEGLRVYDSGEIKIHGKIGIQLQSAYVTDNLTQTLLEKISEYKDKKIEISDIRTFQKEIRGSFYGAKAQTAPCARSDRQPRHRISRRADRRVGR